MHRIWLLILVISLMSGCATRQLAQQNPDSKLIEGHGWVVISAISHNEEIAFEISGGSGESRYKTPLFKQGHTLKLIQLPVGEYQLSGVYDKTVIWRFFQPEAVDNFAFTVVAGETVLIGDLSLDGPTLALRSIALDTNAEKLESLPIKIDKFSIASNTLEDRSWVISPYTCIGRVTRYSSPCGPFVGAR